MQLMETLNLITTITCTVVMINYIRNVVKKNIVELDLTIRALNIKRINSPKD